MSSPPPLAPVLRDELHRRIGRNLVTLQKIEGGWKQLLLTSVESPKSQVKTPPPSDKEAWVHRLQGRALAFHYAGEDAKAEQAALDLARIMEDPNEDRRARFAAIYAIRWTRPRVEAMIDPLLRAIRDPDPEFQRNAAETLLGLELRGMRTVVEPLIRALKEDANPLVRFYVAAALGRIGPEAESAVEPLAQALSDPSWRVRRISIEALASIGPGAQAAIDRLTNVLLDHTNAEWVRADAAMALGQIGPKEKIAVEALTRVLEDESVRVREAAQRSLSAPDPSGTGHT